MRIYGQCGMAAKDDGLVPETARYGRCWWFWLPRLHWNGGIPLRHVCCDVSVKWLCFWCGFYVWSNVNSRREPK